MSSRACFGPGVVACLVAEDTFEHAVALAGNVVLTWAFVIVFLHRVVAIAIRLTTGLDTGYPQDCRRHRL